VTTVVAIFLLGGLLGFGGAFVVKAWRDGRRGAALVAGAVVAAIGLFLTWQAVMVLVVDPSMR
jgi:hypothetical protein